jgi:hypothetical protein
MKKLFLTFLILLFATNCFAQTKIANITKDTGKQIYRCTLGEENDEVVIGDELLTGNVNLSPKVKFTKWNKENSLSIKIPDGLISNLRPTLNAQTKELVIKDSKIGFYFNRADDINFKFGLIFYEKPTTNTWSFQLEGWEEFDFFYQPPLANVNPDGSTWEYRDEINQKGLCKRPVNVSGSWAVYHKTKRDYIIGKTNYKTGKFCHIYNVVFIDADGKQIRIIPQIANGIYSITVPQGFLDDAKYPIRANDTYGITGVAGTSGNFEWGEIFFRPTGTISASGTVTKITMSWLLNDSGSSNNVRVALYSHDAVNDMPESLLVASASTEITTYYDALKDFTVADTSVTSGSYYWMAIYADDYDLKYYYDDGTGTGRAGAINSTYPTMLASPGNTWNDGPWTNFNMSIYATYTPSGGVAPRQGQIVWIE